VQWSRHWRASLLPSFFLLFLPFFLFFFSPVEDKRSTTRILNATTFETRSLLSTRGRGAFSLSPSFLFPPFPLLFFLLSHARDRGTVWLSRRRQGPARAGSPLFPFLFLPFFFFFFFFLFSYKHITIWESRISQKLSVLQGGRLPFPPFLPFPFPLLPPLFFFFFPMDGDAPGTGCWLLPDLLFDRFFPPPFPSPLPFPPFPSLFFFPA